jgi:hypothetical protein
MSLLRKTLLTVALAVLTVGPAFGLPTLSRATPHLSPRSAPLPPTPGAVELPWGLVGLAGAIRIKDTGSIAKKFVQRAGAASGDYAAGVQVAGQDWQTNTVNGKDNYVAGVQQAIADGRFEKGVSAAGAQKYVDNATKLGPQRYQTGVAQAESAYQRGVGPHLDMMKSLDLPPKGPKGSAQNQQRANIVATRNRALKLGK